MISTAPRLRPYQVAAQEAIVKARQQGFRAQLISMATGLGKSVLIATLPKLLQLEDNDVLLVVAHRDELIEQLVGKFAAENPGARITIEKAEQVASIDSNIVVATVQTLAGQRLKEFIGRFGRRIALFVIDEA
ncbi:MAG: DEAD/DEAH box helicase family protein, partial [Candidatus Eremiobacteraeota bacterium]|nr:DEAD/DEAH box helicase family protein [Candidatus Eremiobacteraeota bacterium]